MKKGIYCNYINIPFLLLGLSSKLNINCHLNSLQRSKAIQHQCLAAETEINIETVVHSKPTKISPFLGFISRVDYRKIYMDLKNSSKSEQKWLVVQLDSYSGKEGSAQCPPQISAKNKDSRKVKDLKSFPSNINTAPS